MKLKGFLVLVIVCSSLVVMGQRDSSTVRNSKNAGIKLNYENDFFSGSDDYYTQGIKLELIFPWLRYSPFMLILPRLSNSVVQYELIADQDCFTPTSITVDSIQKGDRPYAGYIYVGQIKTSTQQKEEKRMTAEVDIGEIGSCAECGEEQMMIHRWINDRQPDGWKYQIATQITGNYKLRYEKGLLKDSALDIFGYGEVNAGNAFDNVLAGGRLRMGKMQSYFAGDRTRKFQLYTFLDGYAEGMGYNATLQGALFSNNSIYTLPSNAINHIVFGYTYGICLSYKSIVLEYTTTHITHEIITGGYHGWGHITVGGYF